MPKNLAKCPCCSSQKIGILYKNVKDKSYFAEGSFCLYRCSNCKLEFLNPQLNEKELSKYYPDHYYSFKNKNKLAYYYHKISAYYYSKKNLLFNVLFFPFKALLYKYYIQKRDKGKRILEIGCGDGLKLEIYKKYGLKTAGIEPYGPELTLEQKNLGILRKSVKKVNFPENNFDYIVIKDVIEHVPDQKEILRKCHLWLKPGGKMIISTQNTKGLWAKVFKQNWFGLDVPRHLYNYNPSNISFFLKKNNLKVTSVRIYDSTFMLAGSLKYYLIERTKKKEHSFTYSNFTKVFFTPISLIVSWLKMGSLMEVECTK